METLAGLIEEGRRTGGFGLVPAALVVQIADAAHARPHDPGVLAALGTTHPQAIN
jgi:hypothetical protein